MIVRPPEYLEDIRERELEMQASEARLAQLSYLACQHCGREVEKDFLICPACHSRLREPCESCQRPLETALDASARIARRRSSARSHRAGAAARRYAAEMPPGRLTPLARHDHQGERPRWSARSSSPSPTPTPAT